MGLVEAIQAIHDVPSNHQITKKLESVILIKVRILQTHIVSHSLGVPDLGPVNVPDFQQIPNLLIHGAPGLILRVDRLRPVQVIFDQFLNLWLKILILQPLHQIFIYGLIDFQPVANLESPQLFPLLIPDHIRQKEFLDLFSLYLLQILIIQSHQSDIILILLFIFCHIQSLSLYQFSSQNPFSRPL